MSPRNPLYPLRVLSFAAVVPLLLRLVKLPQLGDRLEPAAPPRDPADPAMVDRLVRRIDLLLRLGWPIVRRGCLVRGLTRYRFLREAGVDAALCFGIGRLPGEESFTGHCWLELDGRALAEPREPRPIYTETYRVSPRPRRDRERGAGAIQTA
ncbi:MAG: lasso peptide biosynthesis B2 protein [Acidobacteriota bacterium]